MTNPYGAKAYHKTSIQTASREQILLMLYEACILNFKRCKQAMEKKNIPDKGMYLGKAQDIINELSNTLDMEKGGDVAQQLKSLYLYIFNESTDANFNNDPSKIENCVRVLNTLYSGWKQAVETLAKNKTEVKK